MFRRDFEIELNRKASLLKRARDLAAWMQAADCVQNHQSGAFLVWITMICYDSIWTESAADITGNSRSGTF
jgi:hypothetical protein